MVNEWTTQRSIRIGPDEWHPAVAAAHAERTTVSAMIRRLLRERLTPTTPDYYTQYLNDLANHHTT